jgi:hypothetical protein
VLFNKAKTTLIQYPAGKSGSYDIPAGVTVIGDNAFYGCSALTGVSIPAGVTSIGDYAFYGCSALTSVTFSAGGNITSFDYNAFPNGVRPGMDYGDELRTAYLAGGAGTYTRTAGGSDWTKQ